MAKQETNINRAIRAREVRVIDDAGEQLGIMSLPQALDAAADQGLDLVEVSPNAKPPVCRIMDYGKFKYQQAKKAAEAKKKAVRVELKEVKMRPKTDEHDFQTKVKHARRFLEAGNKVKVTIMFRGREQAHPERGLMQIEKIVEALSDIAQVEARPSKQGRFMTMVLAPAKK
ncbi:MAG: translation initiation factor IF-3 [Desulfuromonadales bacterium]|nr:translation initiation factor IF-3 [Desulfuromonadales bacterium]NIR33351.1 translation initiation factor IF-3 [Desulfuromonadales bacterium]NIS43346.1 translation initiation factor IF-3 [Desulfuromonadales bacterium]